jgi:arylmalonate decarboxylase
MTVSAELLPRVGLIVPPAHGRVPDDGSILYRGRVQFIARGLALKAITPDCFDAVVDSVTDNAKALAEAGAQAISLMGTSLSFYRGAAVTRQLAAAIQDATGLPSTTMSHAIVRALKATGIQRVAVATAYGDELNARLRSFLQSEGFEVAAIKGLAMIDVLGVEAVSPARLIDLARDVFAQNSSAQGVLISCGGLKTLGVIDALEAILHVPVVSSSPAGFWDVVQLLGVNPTANNCGRLFQTLADRAGSSV